MNLRDRLPFFLAYAQKPRKPTFLEYVESAGGAYIDTGILPTYDMTVKVKYKYTQLNNTFNPIFGMRTAAVGTGNNLFWAGMHYTDKQAYLRFGSNSINYAMGDSALDVIELTASPDGIFINGVDTGARYYDGAMTSQAKPMYLFTINNQYGANGGLGETNARVYSFEVYNGDGALIQDLRPALDPSGKVCMYDMVTKKYFYNAGTGELKAGGRFVESIVFDGKSYIDTGYLPNEQTYVEYTFEVYNATNYQGLFGSRKDQTEEGYVFDVFVRNANYLRIDWGEHIGNEFTNYSLNTKYTMKAGLGEVYLDDTLVKTYTVLATGTSPYSIYLGNINDAGKPYSNGSLQKAYGFKAYENNALIQDLRPYVDGDGVACFKDVVTDTLFYNQGTGTLTYTE